MLPSVSTAGRRRTIARRRAIRATPIASVTVIAAGRPSGMAPTASATAAMNISSQCSPRRIPTPKVSADNARMTTSITFENFAMARVSGVASTSVSPIMREMRPVSVPSPVSTTSPKPWPDTIMVPAKTMFARSASGVSAPSASQCLPTAADSPVSAASAAFIARASMTLRSAGTRSPAASHTKSPGTSARAFSRCLVPLRCTVASLATLRASAASAFSARPSWMKPTRALIRTTPIMTPESTNSPRKKVMADDASRM